MIQKAIPAIYLAYANHNRKKKGIQHLKNLHEELAPILTPVEGENHVSLDREDWDDKPFAYELFQEGHTFPNLSVIHLVVEGDDDENWYLNAPAGKRQVIDWDSLFFDHLKDLKVIFVDGGNSLDVVEKLLFAGTPAVISTDLSSENEIANQFKLSFYHKLIQGYTLENAFETAAKPFETSFISKKIASDPYEYWEAKENEDQADFVSGLYYLSASEKVLDWQIIESGLVIPPPLEFKAIAAVEDTVTDIETEQKTVEETVPGSVSIVEPSVDGHSVAETSEADPESEIDVSPDESDQAETEQETKDEEVPLSEETETTTVPLPEVSLVVEEESINELNEETKEKEDSQLLTEEPLADESLPTINIDSEQIEDEISKTDLLDEESSETDKETEEHSTEIKDSVWVEQEELTEQEAESPDSNSEHSAIEENVEVVKKEVQKPEEENDEEQAPRIFHLSGTMLEESHDEGLNLEEEEIGISEENDLINETNETVEPESEVESEEIVSITIDEEAAEASIEKEVSEITDYAEQTTEQSPETEEKDMLTPEDESDNSAIEEDIKAQAENWDQTVMTGEEEQPAITVASLEVENAESDDTQSREREESSLVEEKPEMEAEVLTLESENTSTRLEEQPSEPAHELSNWLADELDEEKIDQEDEFPDDPDHQPTFKPVMKEDLEAVDNSDEETSREVEAREITYISTLDILELPKAQYFYDIRAHEIDMIHERSISWRLAENLAESDASEEESEDEPEETEEPIAQTTEVSTIKSQEDSISQIVLEEMHPPQEQLISSPTTEQNRSLEKDSSETGLSIPSQLSQSSKLPGSGGGKNQSISSSSGHTGNARFGWKSATGIGMGFLSIVAVILLFIFQDTEEYPITIEESYLTAFESTQSFNILLLPFKQYPNCYAPEAIDESAVRDRLKILKESEDMGIKVAFINEAACPQSSEEAKRIGEVYNADLVVWGNYPLGRQDTNNIHVRYVALSGNQNPSQNYWANLGKLALADIFELQEGKIGGSVEDVIYWLLGIVHLRNEKYQSALTYLKQIEIKESPEYSSVHHLIAKCYQGLERYDQVLAAYNKAIELNPDDANGYYNRGAVYQILRQNDQALADYLEAIRINPRHIKAHYNRKLIADGSVEEDLYIDPQLVEQQLPEIREPEAFAEEIEAEKEAVSRVATNPEPVDETDATLAVQTEFEEEPAEEIESGPAVTYHNLGYQYEQKGQLNEAIYAYTRAIQTDPGQIKSVYSRAALYEKMGKFQQALDDYTAAIQLDSRNLDLYYSRAYLYERMKKYYEAISDYSKIIQLNDRLSNPYLYRGKAYQYVKQNERALKDFEQAIKLNPENATCYFFRARLRQDIGELQAALDDYNHAIEINGGYASAYRERGELLAHFKQYDEALADFDQVLKSNPHDARIYAKRGDVLIQLGQLSKAEADIREAIKLDPENQRYQELLAQINSN